MALGNEKKEKNEIKKSRVYLVKKKKFCNFALD